MAEDDTGEIEEAPRPTPYPFIGHPGPVLAMAVTPDGEEIVTGGSSGTARVWNRRSGKERVLLRGHSGPILTVAATPDGEEIVTGGGDGTALVWNRRSGKERVVLRGHGGPVWAVAVTSDGEEIVTGAQDGTIRVWNRRSSEERMVLRGHSGPVWAVAVTSDGEEIVTGGRDGSTRVWNRRSGKERVVLRGNSGPVLTVVATPDGEDIVTGEGDGTTRVWDRRSGKERVVVQRHRGPVLTVTATPDGKEIVSGGEDGTARIWDRRSNRERAVLRGHSGKVWAVAATPDGEEIVTAGRDGSTRVWDRRSGKERMVLRGHSGPVLAVAATPAGEEIVTGGEDGTARIWNRRSGEERMVLRGHSGLVWAVAATPDGEEIVSGGEDGTVRIWNRRSGEERLALRGHSGTVWAMAATPDGAEIVTGGRDGTARVWDRQSGGERVVLRGHSGTVWAVATTPDGEEIVSGGEDGTVRIWNRRSGNKRVVLRGHSGPVWVVATTPDGEEIASGGGDGTVRIWNRRSGEERVVLRGHSGPVWAVVAAPDGEEIVTGGEDGTARIWNRRSGEERVALRGHSGLVWAVATTPDGEEIVSGGEDGTIRVWNRSTGRQVRGTGLGAMSAARPLAGLRSDEPSDTDLLGIDTEVEMMATLVAAASTEAPLAIGLLGDWGYGKSSFLRQMETQVQELADASANNLGQTEFVAHVSQVRFNAWHYSDDQIWPGLIEHLFRALATEGSDGSQGAVGDPEKAAEVGEQLKEAKAEYEQLNRDLNRLAGKPRPVGRLAGLGSAGELVAVPGVLLKEVWRDIRSSWRSLLEWLVVAAALGAGTAGLLWARESLWGAALALAGLGGAVSKIWCPLKRLHAWILDSAGRQKRRLEGRRDAAHKRIATLRGELALVSASERLHRFVADRKDGSDYAPYRGLLGLVHRDLRELDENLRAALQEWQSLKPPRPKPPLQRIVLYIDDLDRCPPKRVVEVLQAMHLLLALPVFVVVVAVDVRWLELSLKHHFTELLGHRDLPGGVVETAEPVVTPWDYLEKIFQITYALRPMGSQASAYLEALLPSEDETPVAGPPTTQVQTPSITPQPETAEGAPPEADPQDVDEVPHPDTPTRPSAGDGLEEETTKSELFPASAIPARSGPASVRNLRPEGLRMRARERAFIPSLTPLLPTPRAAKRLINIYRLIRIGVADEDLEAFVGNDSGGPYQAVGLLVAIVVGHPHLVHTLLRELQATTVPDFFVLLGQLQKTRPPSEHEDWGRLLDQLDVVGKTHTSLVSDTAEFRRWGPKVARFSLHTRDLIDDGEA